jgi:hypothetical protein
MPEEGATTGTTHDARLHASERAGRQLLRSCPGTSSESARPGCCSSTGAAVTCARANARSLLSWTRSGSAADLPAECSFPMGAILSPTLCGFASRGGAGKLAELDAPPHGHPSGAVLLRRTSRGICGLTASRRVICFPRCRSVLVLRSPRSVRIDANDRGAPASYRQCLRVGDERSSGSRPRRGWRSRRAGRAT